LRQEFMRVRNWTGEVCCGSLRTPADLLVALFNADWLDSPHRRVDRPR
jgi:hypothetical protein